MKKLQVGQKLYYYNKFSRCYQSTIIVKTTKKSAYSENETFKLEYDDNATEIRSISKHKIIFYFENDEILKSISIINYICTIRRKVMNMYENHDKISIDGIDELSKICDSVSRFYNFYFKE